jgi:hypothetical protein
MTTQISASVNATALQFGNDQHIFKMSDARLVAIWNNGGNTYRSTSTDAGVTWSAPSIIFNNGNSVALFAACVNGDTIYGAYSRQPSIVSAFKMVYAAGAFTDSHADVQLTPASTNIQTAGYMVAVWDSVKGNFHLACSWVDNSNQGGCGIAAISTSLTLIAMSGGRTNTATTEGAYALLIDTAGTPNLYWVVGSEGFGKVKLYTCTWSGAAYGAFGAFETVEAAANSSGLAAAFDQSGNVDIFYELTGTLRTRKRTGVNTYSAATTLSSSVHGTDRVPALARTGNVNGDVLVFWNRIADQANGEIYAIKRLSGTWGAGTRVAGGSSGGWQTPTAIDLIPADGIAHLLYLTGTATFPLIYDPSVLTGVAPYAPINLSPSGTANTSLTPTINATYKNASPSDALGSYEVLVTRQSDSVVMWDTTKTAYSGSPIVDGGVFSLVYAGTGLAKGIVYLLQVKFWDANANLAGPYNTAVTFTVNDAPAVAITSSATPSGSGPTVTWTYSQTLGHVQTSYRIVVKNVSDTTTIYDSGTVTSAATSAALPSGTLANGVSTHLSVTATSSDGL